jgi:hypothetical protein
LGRPGRQLGYFKYDRRLPAVGWWRERTNLNKWDKRCRYALVVSIRTPELTENIYVPVAAKVGVPIEIPVG